MQSSKCHAITNNAQSWKLDGLYKISAVNGEMRPFFYKVSGLMRFRCSLPEILPKARGHSRTTGIVWNLYKGYISSPFPLK